MSSLEFKFKKIDERRNDLLEEINHNNLMGEKYKKNPWTFAYFSFNSY